MSHEQQEGKTTEDLTQQNRNLRVEVILLEEKNILGSHVRERRGFQFVCG